MQGHLGSPLHGEQWQVLHADAPLPHPTLNKSNTEHGDCCLKKKEDVPAQLTAATSRVPDAETGMASSLAPG